MTMRLIISPPRRTVKSHDLRDPRCRAARALPGYAFDDGEGSEGGGRRRWSPRYADCPSNTNYTRGGVFQANLEALISFLPAAASAASGFTKNTTGAAPDEAYGLAQCGADVNTSVCLACLDTLARDAASKCPGQKSSMLIYDDCVSNASFFGAASTSPVYSFCNVENATEPDLFRTQLGSLMGNLTSKAAYSTPRSFAAGVADFTPFAKIYGMAQCTRDLSADDCNMCLTVAVMYIPTACDGKPRRGGRVFSRSCSIRYEVYQFYNAQAVEAAMSQAAPEGGGGVNGSDQFGPAGRAGNSATAKIALAVSVPVAVVLLMMLTIAFYIRKRNKKPHKHVQISSADSADGEDMISSQSLLYELLPTTSPKNINSGKAGLGQYTKARCMMGRRSR
uniref:Uncharacterized protein n=1 Tax=Avena sativa TaxID=4498 RepID=A0ACD5U1G6_AVESA